MAPPTLFSEGDPYTHHSLGNAHATSKMSGRGRLDGEQRGALRRRVRLNGRGGGVFRY